MLFSLCSLLMKHTKQPCKTRREREREAASKIVSNRCKLNQERRENRELNDWERDKRKEKIRRRRAGERMLEVIDGFEDDEAEARAIQCSICLTYKINVHWSCGHGYCYQCTRQLILSESDCPLCLRSPTRLLNTFT